MRNAKSIMTIAAMTLLSASFNVNAKDGDRGHDRGNRSEHSQDQGRHTSRSNKHNKSNNDHARHSREHRQDKHRSADRRVYNKRPNSQLGKKHSSRLKGPGHKRSHYVQQNRRHQRSKAHYRTPTRHYYGNNHSHRRIQPRGYGDSLALSLWLDGFAVSYQDYNH